MNFSLICRHKGADNRSSVHQREVGNWKYTVFTSFLTWSNTVALFHTDLQICIFFCQLFNVRLKDLHTELPTLNHLWNANPINSSHLMHFLWYFPLLFYSFPEMSGLGLQNIFSYCSDLCFIRFSCWPCVYKCLLWGSH